MPLRRYDADLIVPRDVRLECDVLKAVTAHFVMAREGAATLQAAQRARCRAGGSRLDGAPDTLDVALRPAFVQAVDDAAQPARRRRPRGVAHRPGGAGAACQALGMNEVHRLAAFSADPSGGNPRASCQMRAACRIDDMLQIAADVGYSETAFLVDAGNGSYDVRYFSPLAEVPFCGHATIASGVLLGPGEWLFATRSGDVAVDVSRQDDGLVTATLTSVSPHVDDIADDDLAELLAALGWAVGMPIRRCRLASPTRARTTRFSLYESTTDFSRLDYDVDRLRTLMLERDWTTIDLVWRESDRVFHARNPFPVGGVYEDPATGAAATAFGAYLRELGPGQPPVTVTIHQGGEMGRPSTLPGGAARGRRPVRVSGTAVHIPRGR